MRVVEAEQLNRFCERARPISTLYRSCVGQRGIALESTGQTRHGTQSTICNACGGTGTLDHPGGGASLCPQCGGDGFIEMNSYRGNRNER